MAGEWLISTRKEIRKLYLPEAAWGSAAQMDHASALCARGGYVFCAGRDALYSLDAQSLLPARVFASAPDIRALLLSGDGTRLYALSAEADSVLMISTRTGEVQILCCAGVSPPSMALDEAGGLLFVAGGKRPGVLVLCAHTLRLMEEISLPGPVCSVASRGGNWAALCLTDTMDTLLVFADGRGGKPRKRKLCGFPGALLLLDGAAVAGVQGRMHVVSLPDLQVLRSMAAPGCPGAIAPEGGALLYLDRLNETLYQFRGGRFSLLAADVQAFAPLERIHR